MKEFLNYFCFGFLTCLIFMAIVNGCEKKPVVTKTDTIEVVKKRVDTLKVEVVKWKEAKSKIVYRTNFDSTATIDTVIVELNKCDTVVKIDSVIIQKLDTIIIGKDEIISDLDSHNQVLQDEVKKQKRKLFFTKVLAGVVVVLTILLAK